MLTFNNQHLRFVLVALLSLIDCTTCRQLHPEEAEVLRTVLRTLGAEGLDVSTDCEASSTILPIIGDVTDGRSSEVTCDCLPYFNGTCHVTNFVLKGFDFTGILPPELANLTYLQRIQLNRNYLRGVVPKEWASLKHLTFISLRANRLAGNIPAYLEEFTSLNYLRLEANQFNGSVPPQLGNLLNLTDLILSNNQLEGELPEELGQLKNLQQFRISDNNLSGTIPSFIQNWTRLHRLELHATGLKGPVPPGILYLQNMTDLRISDIAGPEIQFPNMSDMSTKLKNLILRNINLVGKLPEDLWKLDHLNVLDVSFNKLVGRIPDTIAADRLRFVFLTGNLLTGDIPESILKAGSNIDLSYNNFTFQGSEKPSCRENMNLNLNLYQSSSAGNNSQLHPCVNMFKCPQYSSCLHVNCGGKDITLKENKTSILYEGDAAVEGGAAKYFENLKSGWGFSSTGDFMDDNDFQNTRYTVSLHSSNISELYSTVRKSPISLTYFHNCLENRKYTVKLHFAEIQFTNDETYNSLGRRMFDIFVQERLVQKDFNIKERAGGTQKPLVIEVPDVDVTDNRVEIRLYFSGKGTTRIPYRGVYGPIISAISVASDLNLCSSHKKKGTAFISVAIVGALCFIFFIILGILWRGGYLQRKLDKRKDIEGPDMPTGTFSLKQIRTATNDFDPANKIGEGGFGPVYKGTLSDGTLIAVKQLSSKSRQGNREFMNEIGMISCLQHPNLVKLHGFCVEMDQLLLVYEYMDNNSLARALFDENNPLKMDWPTRVKICVGLAKGLAFLHEESTLKIVHRDIKATNVLLDMDLNPKISDFGLARLDEVEKSHISTRVAGTIGYMAPEYALWGYLTDKADVYSFGVVVLETVSGKNNNNFMPSNHCVCLLDWACHLQQSENLIELLDEPLRPKMNKKEVEMLVKIGLLCTSASPTLRPTMSEVVNMLEGRMAVPDTVPDSSSYTEDLRFKAMRDLRQHSQSITGSQTQNSTTVHTFGSSSISEQDFFDIKPVSEPNTRV